VFFRNSACLACGTALGYDPDRARLLPLLPAPRAGLWVPAVGPKRGAPRYRRCPNLDGPAGCNWLLPEADGPGTLCRCCRLNRTLPDLSVAENALWFGRIAQAQRRLLSLLIALGLPTPSRADDPQRGLAFDLLRQLPDGPAVVTGHADGVITLDVAEADDAQREQRRDALGEPYRTLLGHLRHESGHFYWQRLVDGGAWLAPFRALFGDERADYAAALRVHYANGAPADWSDRHVSSYASCHPWEDWAETWAHYLHLVDTLDTARGFGLHGGQVELRYERWTAADLALPDGSGDALQDAPAASALAMDGAAAFLDLVNGWMELTGVLNELSRSMGLADFYPFVLSRPALRKLFVVHRLVQSLAPARAQALAALGVAPRPPRRRLGAAAAAPAGDQRATASSGPSDPAAGLPAATGVPAGSRPAGDGGR
jgi:hypothetical protein